MIFNSPDNYKGLGVKCTEGQGALATSHRGNGSQSTQAICQSDEGLPLAPMRDFASCTSALVEMTELGVQIASPEHPPRVYVLMNLVVPIVRKLLFLGCQGVFFFLFP